MSKSNFVKWLYAFPMPDGRPARTIWPGLIALVVVTLILLALVVLAQWHVSGYNAVHAAELEHTYLPVVSFDVCPPPAFRSGKGCLVLPPGGPLPIP